MEKVFSLVIGVFILLLLPTIYVDAVATVDGSSVLISKTFSGGVAVCQSPNAECSSSAKYISVGFNNPNVSIKYNTTIKNITTGLNVMCGDTILKGDELKLMFNKHSSSDVFWFGTGSYLDSPYGDWGIPSDPVDVTCNEKDFVGESQSPWAESQKLYTRFFVEEPTKSITWTNNLLDCGQFNGSSVNCVANNIGNVDNIFHINETMGIFYASWFIKPIISQFTSQGVTPPSENVCYGTSIPMLMLKNSFFDRTSRGWLHFSENATYENKKYKYKGSILSRRDSVEFAIDSAVLTCPITIIESTGQAPNAPTITNNGTCTVNNNFSMQVTATDPDAQSSDPESNGGSTGNNDKSRIKFAIDWTGNGTTEQLIPSSGLIPSGSVITISRTYATAGVKSVKVRTIDGEGLSSPWVTASFTCSDDPEEGDSTIVAGGDDTTPNNASTTDPEAGIGGNPETAITAVNRIVNKGSTTIIQWRTHDVKNCKVTGSNGDGPWVSDQGEEVTSPMVGKTIYTLQCEDSSGNAVDPESVTVDVTGSWVEN